MSKDNNKKSNNTDTTRRSALKKIAGASGAIIGLSYTKMVWANPSSGIVESKGAAKAEAVSTAVLFEDCTTCAPLTTFQTTATPTLQGTIPTMNPRTTPPPR